MLQYPLLTNQEKLQLLSSLEPEQLSQAWGWIASPMQSPPPFKLKQQEWEFLSYLLQMEMQLKNSQVLQ